MTVLFSKKCELGLQAILYLSTLELSTGKSSGEISEKLDIPKEFVSKVLQLLTKSGLVGSKKGKQGGFYLAKPANEIRLFDIVKSIDGTKLFETCVLGFPGCTTSKPCPVHNIWGKIRDDTYNMLNEQTLEELRDLTKEKIACFNI